MISYNNLTTDSLGKLLLTADETHLTGIYYADSKHAPVIAADWKFDAAHPALQDAANQLVEFLAGERVGFSLAIRAQGTPFQQEVWRQIALIPFGTTITYSELARRAGAPDAIRAAGAATGRNPHSIVVPCHRVVGKNGSMHGYAGGLERKQALLAVENRDKMLV